MSKKSKARRGTPARRPPAGPTAPAGAGRTEVDAAIGRIMSRLRSAMASGDPLQAELETAVCMAIPRVTGDTDPGDEEAFISAMLVDGAVDEGTPESAALLRVLMSLGTPDIKRKASRALADLTGDGVYPPDWVAGVGKATPRQAWRRYDVFGDGEAIVVTFSYGEAEHGIVAQVDLAGVPVATAVGVSTDAARLVEAVGSGHDEFERADQISLAEARRRLAGPLDRAFQDPDPDMSVDSFASLPIARSRVRRLPDGEAGGSGPAFTAADRAAAVDEFMKSPQAAEAVAADEEATRFWAEVLTGYSSRVPGQAPAQAGPRTLAHILLGHVPNSFALSPAQRGHLEPAVTAWMRWSASHRGLDEAATEALMERVPGVLGRFGPAYDDPDAAAIRGYASGLAASDADVAWLSDRVGRRMFALPLPESHGPLDLADPADRRALVQAEFGECTPPAGLTSDEFVQAAYRLIEELWQDEESPAFRAASRMFAEGVPRHDIIHRLAGPSSPSGR